MVNIFIVFKSAQNIQKLKPLKNVLTSHDVKIKVNVRKHGSTSLSKTCV